MKKIRKAVIPAAGFGTRFLPFTKAVPKELIPLVDKPVIQYVVEEAAAAGIDQILIITSNGKNAIQDHFNRAFELESRLEATKKQELLEELRSISRLADIHYIHQQELNGLGDAVRCAKSFVGNDPFAVLLGDTVLDSATETTVTGQLVAAFETFESPVTALETVPMERGEPLRRGGRRMYRRGALQSQRVGREARSGGGAEQSGHRLPLHLHAGYHGGAGKDAARQRQRDPADRRDAPSALAPCNVRAGHRRKTLRSRQ